MYERQKVHAKHDQLHFFIQSFRRYVNSAGPAKCTLIVVLEHAE